MKILTIHADFIEFQAKKKALKTAGEISKELIKVEECLVVFTAFEKRDEGNVSEILNKYVSEVENILKQVKAEKIVLYPYAHLSSDLGNPAKADKFLKDASLELGKKYEVICAPFGWYKSFDISCKGHPLSELSREFSASSEDKDNEVSDALKIEDKIISSWYILGVDGKLNPIKYDKKKFTGFDFKKYPGLKKFASYEMAKNRIANQEPPHVRLMKKLELVDYEPGSDPGNLRYYPKGRLIKGLIENYVTSQVKEYGAMEIEAPIMYDYEHPALKSYLHRFPARQYAIQTPNKKVFLRFAACFGQFLIMHDAQVSYKQMPVRMYEMTRYSFRVEQHGELTGLRRLRAFTMPDTHAFCTDVKQANKEMMKRIDMSWKIQEGIGLDMSKDMEFAIRVTKDMWDKNEKHIKDMVKRFGKPTLIEMWDKRFFYFSIKYEWNFVDALDKCSTLATDQMDVENGKRYDITYVDSSGKKKNPLILHCSPSGAVERVIYALLEREAMCEKEGKIPILPLWLCPTQIRLIPVSIEKHLKRCEELSLAFNFRVDIDDREESVGKRIRSSGQEWTPFTIVVGDNELSGDELIVRDRVIGKDVKMTISELNKKIAKETAGRPYDTLPLPKLLSKRIRFV